MYTHAGEVTVQPPDACELIGDFYYMNRPFLNPVRLAVSSEQKDPISI